MFRKCFQILSGDSISVQRSLTALRVCATNVSLDYVYREGMGSDRIGVGYTKDVDHRQTLSSTLKMSTTITAFLTLQISFQMTNKQKLHM